jgi:predicted flap endonuclease-1-like 5' DNA nuclease
MIAVVGQMLFCLLLAAAIGLAVGWLLWHRSSLSHEQRVTDLDSELRIKGQALDTAIYELKVKTAAAMALESKVSSLESLGRSAQEELTSRQDRIDRLQQELKDNQARSLASQSEFHAQLEQLAEQETTLAAYANEVRQANAARNKAQQELAVRDQEILDMHKRLADADRRLEEVDRLRMKLQDLEPAQGRVHWLEVQLSEKEAQHRHVVHRLEEDLALRDRRLAEQAEHAKKIMGDQEEEIIRLRKRLGEVRAALREHSDGSPVLARPNGPANQLSLQMPPPKALAPRKDDLKKIQGISPAIERALNKLGTFTYVQIARWKPSDIARIAKKLDSLPGRIKPDHWIAGAKKQHREKYGEKL